MPDQWFFQLFEDQDDPHTPLFWETMNWASRQGLDLLTPQVDLPEPSIGVQVQELKRQVALKTPTMAMPVMDKPDTVD